MSTLLPDQVNHALNDLDPDRTQALTMVLIELLHQQDKWGEQNHGIDRWTIVELEELGEVAQASLKMREDPDHRNAHFTELLNEWANVAAVAITAYASLLRQERRFRGPGEARA